MTTQSKGLVIMLCLFAGPFFQLLGDALWLSRTFNFSWNIWREAAYVFFIPTGFLFAKMVEQKSVWWAMICCALFIIGCVGAAAMMPLFRLGAFYPITGHNAFPLVVNSVLGKKLFGATLYPPGLCFPVSLVLFGSAFLKNKILDKLTAVAFILSGIFFWLGNAGEIDSLLIIGDVWLLATFCYVGYLTYSTVVPALSAKSMARNAAAVALEQPGS